MIGTDLSCESYRRTLYQPFYVHQKRNSSVIIATIVTHVPVTIGAIKALLQTLSSFLISFVLFIGILMINLPAAVLSLILFAGAYVSISILSRPTLISNSQKIASASQSQVKCLQEGLGAIRDVLLDGSQDLYLKSYTRADALQRRLQATNAFLKQYPRYAKKTWATC